MVSETRVLFFADNEISQAIHEFCRRTHRGIPNGGFKKFSFSDGDDLKVIAESDGSVDSSVFYSNEIAAALLLFCQRNGIPVARRAKKSVELLDRSLCLRLVMR